MLGNAIKNFWKKFPHFGIREIKHELCCKHKWYISQWVFELLTPLCKDVLKILFLYSSWINSWCRVNEPHLLRAHLMWCFCWKVFYATGVNHIWAMDQHDKWEQFGLWLHIGLDPYSGKILWLNIWWTNSNPRLIASYYLASVHEHKGKWLHRN